MINIVKYSHIFRSEKSNAIIRSDNYLLNLEKLFALGKIVFIHMHENSCFAIICGLCSWSIAWRPASAISS